MAAVSADLPSNAVLCRAFARRRRLQFGSRVRHDCGPIRRARWANHPSAHRHPRDPEDRLDSWKEIAAYLKRDVTTVQRWEKREGMPVHRHLHDRMGSVYASRAELDAWTRSRNLRSSARRMETMPSRRPSRSTAVAAGDTDLS